MSGANVSTPPATPDQARIVFASGRLSLAERYAAMLATDGVARGLIGPHEAPRLWDRHLLNCAVLGSAVPSGATVGDLGSGAGLPGLVLAIARPDLRITLVEPLLRRVRFLHEAVDALGLDQVEIIRARAEQLNGSHRFDVVTSRALAPLERLLAWSMPLVDPEGAVLAMKGSSVAAEITAARPTLTRLGCGSPEVVTLGEGVVAEPTVIVRVPWADAARVSWPTGARPLPMASPTIPPSSASGGAARDR